MDTIAQDVKRDSGKYWDTPDMFDPSLFRRDVTRAGGLSVNTKIILRKAPHARTREETMAVNVSTGPGLLKL